jgi:predicted RNase H-like nuclease (RuvC/YqgF family)
MSDDDIPASLAEAMAEIRRLRDRNDLLELNVETLRKFPAELRERLEIMQANAVATARETAQHVSRLQARITELEAAAAVLTGTMAASQTMNTAPPTVYTFNVPPSAPPHNERPPIGNDDE